MFIANILIKCGFIGTELTFFTPPQKEIWNYVTHFAEFNNFINSPVANYRGEMFNLPFNMNTFSKMWGIQTPRQAMDIIEEQRNL